MVKSLNYYSSEQPEEIISWINPVRELELHNFKRLGEISLKAFSGNQSHNRRNIKVCKRIGSKSPFRN